jgi:hypothetical protein
MLASVARWRKVSALEKNTVNRFMTMQNLTVMDQR